MMTIKEKSPKIMFVFSRWRKETTKLNLPPLAKEKKNKVNLKISPHRQTAKLYYIYNMREIYLYWKIYIYKRERDLNITREAPNKLNFSLFRIIKYSILFHLGRKKRGGKRFFFLFWCSRVWLRSNDEYQSQRRYKLDIYARGR